MSNSNSPTFDEKRRLEEPDIFPSKDSRTAFQNDRDRILYSSAFRRLAGVTQVAAVREHHLLHNRLTHSLKVAQIGRRMAQHLVDENKDFHFGLEDPSSLPDIVEAAGLAHDIGHPPFGHIAERILHEELKKFGASFEGNAQSFRLVTRLASRRTGMDGLNLSRATLNGVLKYPQFKHQVAAVRGKHKWHNRGYGTKWGVYESEEEWFDFARLRRRTPDSVDPKVRSTAAALVDWADDVSYAIHDVADYFRGGLIPLDIIHLETRLSDKKLRKRRKHFLEFAKGELKGRHRKFDCDRFVEQYDQLAENLDLMEPWTDMRQDRYDLNQIQRKLHQLYVSRVRKSEKPPYVKIDIDHQYQIEALKLFTWFYVIKQPSLSMAQSGQTVIIKALLYELMGMLEKYDPVSKFTSHIPAHLRDRYRDVLDFDAQNPDVMEDGHRRARAVCDYLCTLTEDQAVDVYERITGHSVSRGSIFGAWFH